MWKRWQSPQLPKRRGSTCSPTLLELSAHVFPTCGAPFAASLHRFVIIHLGPKNPHPHTQESISGQLNKGWVPLSEHLNQDYDEVLTWDRLHCLETTITHALSTCSTLLPNCLPLLQEVENDICMHVQLMSAQSNMMAWYMVLGTYAILAAHINNLTSCSARRGPFHTAALTSTPPNHSHPSLPSLPIPPPNH